MPNKLEGGCLCGAVRNSATTDPQMVADCYCSDCRKSSGTSHGTHVVLPVAGVTVEGKLTSFDKPADSGHVVSRAFCPVCGLSDLFDKFSDGRDDLYPGIEP